MKSLLWGLWDWGDIFLALKSKLYFWRRGWVKRADSWLNSLIRSAGNFRIWNNVDHQGAVSTWFFHTTNDWRRKWQPTPVLLPGKSHGRRSLVGCSPWGHKESATTEWLHFTSQHLMLLQCLLVGTARKSQGPHVQTSPCFFLLVTSKKKCQSWSFYKHKETNSRYQCGQL